VSEWGLHAGTFGSSGSGIGESAEIPMELRNDGVTARNRLTQDEAVMKKRKRNLRRSPKISGSRVKY
jgi:hypothetical protein